MSEVRSLLAQLRGYRRGNGGSIPPHSPRFGKEKQVRLLLIKDALNGETRDLTAGSGRVRLVHVTDALRFYSVMEASIPVEDGARGRYPLGPLRGE